MISADLLCIIEIIVSLLPLGFAMYQFFKLRRLKKIEKKLLLYSRFFYLESLLSETVERLKKILEYGNRIFELNLQELAVAYKLDSSVLDVVSEISELSYGYFDSMDRDTAKKVQDFLSCASETYHMLNSFYGIIEKGNITRLDEYSEEIIKMILIMKDGFDSYRIEMYKHCVVKGIRNTNYLVIRPMRCEE